jgi:hypothetical protein
MALKAPIPRKFDPYLETNYNDDLANFLYRILPENFPWRKNKYLFRAHLEARRRQQQAAKEAMDRLVKRWGKFPRKSLSVIACPFRGCEHHCIDRGTKPLAEVFDSHVKRVHNVKPTKTCLDLITSKIQEFSSMRFKHYQDPFLYVSLESVTQK